MSGGGKTLFIIQLSLPQQGKHCLYKTSKVAATDINSILREPLPNQISLFSLILSLTSKETVKTRIPTGRAPVVWYIFSRAEIPTVALFFPRDCVTVCIYLVWKRISLDPQVLLTFRFVRNVAGAAAGVGRAVGAKGQSLSRCPGKREAPRLGVKPTLKPTRCGAVVCQRLCQSEGKERTSSQARDS